MSVSPLTGIRRALSHRNSMGEGRRSRHRPEIGVVAVLVLLVGCGTPEERLDELRALPEADLAYPGSEEVNGGGREAEMTVSGPVSAATWMWFGVNATAEEIEDFYAEELSSRGWVDGGGSSGIRTTTELSAHAWHKGDVVFRLAFPDPKEHLDQELFEQHQTVYDARLIGKDVRP